MTLSQERTAHPYHMHDAITGQPRAIARVIAEEHENVRRLAEIVRDSARVHVVGIGTSWHAALVGEDLLRNHGGRQDARAWNSFEFCARPPALADGDAVIVLSHRGTKTYSARALEWAHEAGVATGLLTGVGSDARRELASVVVETSEPDPSSAFTISHTAALTALTMLAVELSGEDSSASHLRPSRRGAGRYRRGRLSQELGCAVQGCGAILFPWNRFERINLIRGRPQDEGS